MVDPRTTEYREISTTATTSSGLTYSAVDGNIYYVVQVPWYKKTFFELWNDFKAWKHERKAKKLKEKYEEWDHQGDV